MSQASGAVKRAIGLGSDAIVLTLASPFFAGWFIFRLMKRWIGPR